MTLDEQCFWQARRIRLEFFLRTSETEKKGCWNSSWDVEHPVVEELTFRKCISLTVLSKCGSINERLYINAALILASATRQAF